MQALPSSRNGNGRPSSIPAVRPSAPRASADVGPAEPDPEAALRARYTDPDDRAPSSERTRSRTTYRSRRALAGFERHRQGLRGLQPCSTRFDLEAIFLYARSTPATSAGSRDTLNDDAAADLLLHWREYFGMKRADDVDRGLLIAEIGRLSAAQRRVAAAHPGALPLLLADPPGVTELVGRWSGDPADLNDLLILLNFISLEKGATDLRAGLRTVDDHGPLALAAFRLQGLDGFALVSLYGPVLDAVGGAMAPDQALILLRVNSDYVDELLQTHRPETVAGHLRHVAAAGLVDAVGGSPNALRLVVEHGARGELALRQAGADAADVVYDDFDDATLRNQAVEALAEHGTMALAMLDKYATDPDFREILRQHGAAIIPPIAQSDSGPETLDRLRGKSKRSFTESLALSVLFLSGENGQATIRTIKNDGLERVASLNNTDVAFYQFLPLYDLLHLGNVLRHGHAPTTGEMTWALIDGCFVVADALSLSALQPEGAVAAEAARAEIKSATREGVKALGREAVEEPTQSAAVRRRSRKERRGRGRRGGDRASRPLVGRPQGGRDVPGPPQDARRPSPA